MNGSWSDQDLSRESDLIGPGGESEGVGDAVHLPDGNHQDGDDGILYADHENGHEMMGSVDGAGPVSQEPSEDGYSSSSSLGMEYADQDDEEEEAEEEGMVGGDDSDPQNARQTLASSLGDGDSPTGRTGAKRHHGVLNMHHVDMILDNIDAQLNEIINRSLNSENSENSYHEDVTSPSRTGVGKMVLMSPGPTAESGDDATPDDRGQDDGSASDTGLGTGSHTGNCSPNPGRRVYPQEHSALNTPSTGVMKRTNGASKKHNGNKKSAKRQIIVEVSDVDSICSEDVRLRMEETLNLQDYDSDAPLSSEHSQHNPSHSHDALQNHAGSYSATSTANHEPGVGTSDEMDSENEVISLADCEPEDISSRIQEMVSMVLSDSTSEAPQSDETDATPESTKPSRHPKKHLPKSSISTPRSKAPSEHGTAAEFVAPNSHSFLEYRRAGRGIDADSIATEDFENVFQESIIRQDPSSRPKTKNPSQTQNNPSGHARGRRLPQTTQSTMRIDRLTVPVVGKSGKPRSRKKRSVTMETSKPSGLPEYMYLRKGISESDVGSDSIRTEDYEGHFEVARVVDLRAPSTKYANRSNNSLTGRALNVQSDPESVQTEEYEQRFRSLMVKQVAGVPLKSFDQVTIASDLESVETGMVHQKFQEVLRKGPEVRLFDEFGDQSDLDPVQMADVERKFQAIRRQKKLEKMRHSHHDGDTDDEGISDLDSVRAVRSKSEAGSPPTRQSMNGHSTGQTVHNGTHGKPIGRSQDGSQRTSASNSTRSSTRATTAGRQPNQSQPWGEQRGASPISSKPSPGGSTSAHPHAQPHVNYDKRNLQSKDQTNHRKRNGVNHQLSSNPHSYEPPRMKQGIKKRKKRSIRENGVRTSAANANPGSRHHLNNVSQGWDEKDRSGQDQMATIRELLETETKMRKKLDDLESSFEEVSAKKQAALGDLKDLREVVHRNKRDIKTAEEIARESMERADGLRSELMVLEYQRDQARRDLQDMTQSVDAIQQSHGRSAPVEKSARMSSDVLGLSPKDVFAVIKERDELRTRVRNGEGDLSPMERSELERQLNYTKQELFNDQKVSRAKVESLQEDLEESRHKFQELLLEKTTLAEKLRDLKEAISSSERVDQMSPHAEERSKLLEQLTLKLQKELDGARHQVHEKDQRLLALTALVSEKDKLYDALKEKMVAMQKKEVEEKRGAERAVAEAEGKARNADVVKELALVELRETLLREKREEVEQLKLSLEKDKKDALAALDEKTSQILLVTQRSLTEKEDDLKAVRLQLVHQTEEANKMEQQLRELADEQVKAAVEKERSEREAEYKRRRREENIEKELEVAKETSRLQGELHVTRQRLEHSQTTLAVLKEELDKIRAENLAAGREKVEAVSEAREKARDDIQRELDQLREQLAKENLLEVDRLRLKLRQQDEELTKLRSEVKNHQQKEARSNSVMDSKSILAEINEECKRTAAVIESTPLKMNLSSIRGSKALNGTLSPKGPFSSTPKSTLSPGRTQVMAALTNLRISNEELRNHVQTLKTDLERQKRVASKAQKEKDEEVKKVANTIEKKSEDMETMKDTLIQDHLTQVEDLQQQVGRLRTAESSLQQRLMDKDSELREIQHSMTQWKEETALKMAKKFEEELGKELEIRLQDTGKRDGSAYRGSQSDLRSKHSSDMSTPSSTSDASTIRLLRHLQERVKQLRTENLSLRKSSRGPLESSGEERGSPHSSKSSGSNDKDHLLYQLQQRVKLLERQLQVAEERCREHAASVSDKTSDNNRLQNALTQQTKELMKMERAYSKLANPPRTPIRL